MAGHHDGGAEEPGGQAGLEPVATRLPLRLSFSESGPRLLPAVGGVPGALAALLVAVNAAVGDGSWTRLKICPADDCRWAFYDTSKNRSRTWCDMRVCGNREKTRAYRARQRPAG
jgi:predicted RNA-binding Zn ribbon-like protein